MAQANIHPKQHKVTVEMTDGSKFDIMTNWGKEGETLKLDVDPKNHPAWQDGKTGFINVNDDRVSKFNKKFGNFDFSVSEGKVQSPKVEDSHEAESSKEEVSKAETPKKSDS